MPNREFMHNISTREESVKVGTEVIKTTNKLSIAGNASITGTIFNNGGSFDKSSP